jgi:hypothetical protein
MGAIRLIEYEYASPEVRAVYDDIMTTRKVDAVNNFWKAIANDPATFRRTWESLKQIMRPGRSTRSPRSCSRLLSAFRTAADTASPPTQLLPGSGA